MPHNITARQVRIALIQGREQGNPSTDLAYTVARIREAAASGAQIVCTQELFNTPYFCRTQDTKHFDLAEPIPGATTALTRSRRRRAWHRHYRALFEQPCLGCLS
jgi:N-carbamoylputrescine amidase